jgi:mono/diheme cytochrome c family protein
MRNTFTLLIACALLATLFSLPASSAERAKPTPSGKAPTRDVMQQGKAVFDQWCLGCHGPLPGMGRFPPAGTNRLQQRYKDAVPATLEDRADLTPDLIRTVVRQGMPIMPPLRKTEVTDAELDAVIAHLTQKKRK